VDAFEHLVGLATLFPDPNLRVEILGVSIDEVRVPSRRRPGYRVADRRLSAVHAGCLLGTPGDLWRLLPEDDWHEPFTTDELARRTGKPLWLAQRIAYCLRLSGAATVMGKRGNHRVYVRSDAAGDVSTSAETIVLPDHLVAAGSRCRAAVQV
jgi:hypothetical protein